MNDRVLRTHLTSKIAGGNKRSVKVRYDQWENSRTKRRKILIQWCQRHERIKMIIFTQAQWIIGEYVWRGRFLFDVMHNYYLVMRRKTKLLLKSHWHWGDFECLVISGGVSGSSRKTKKMATGNTPNMTQLSQVLCDWIYINLLGYSRLFRPECAVQAGQ